LTLQVAYAHLLFNISGILIWYVIWPLRAVPINAAKFLGNTTAEYKWFAPTYLFFAFFLIPLLFFAFSLAGTATFVVMITLTLVTAGFILIVNVLQTRAPWALPEILKTWEFLPVWMRSLEPMDRRVCGPLSIMVRKMCPCIKAKQTEGAKTSSTGQDVRDVEMNSPATIVSA